jgi:p-aminobenzoyl-glutamate transporter AbgT
MASSFPALRLLWRIGAGLVGFVVVEVATTVGFTPLGGIIQVTMPLRIHILATLVAIVAGLLGGSAATLAGGGVSLLPVGITAGIIAVESAYIIAYHRGANPVCFEFFGAATLFGATLAGGFLVRHMATARRTRLATTISEP